MQNSWFCDINNNKHITTSYALLFMDLFNSLIKNEVFDLVNWNKL